MRKNSACIIVIIFAVLWTGCETAFETNLVGKKVSLLAPVNGLITTDTSQTFYWERMNGAGQYRLQVVSPRFDSIARFIEDTTIVFDRFTIDLDTGQYQWRVRALNSGSVSDLSDTWNVRIQ